MAACPHLSQAALRPPRPDEPVYREDCTLCFDGVDDPTGIDVCLHCFNGGCTGERFHSRSHAHQSHHPLALNIRRSRKRKIRADGEPPEKISRLAIAAETEEDRYDFQTEVHCLECGVGGLESDANLASIAERVMKAHTYARQQEIKAWEQEITACEHTLCLEQEPGKTIASDDLSRCSGCELKENLWLCLACGNLGCGRQQMGGLPGNSHAKSHAQTTNHPVAVKLGSLTADGSADIYCYGCDDERVDPELVGHLANWGIDIAGRVKTEKSLTEMNLEENLRWEFSMTTGDGKEMQPLFGPGFTGLKNLGNTCYMASVLQSVFAMPEFVNRYYRPNEDVTSTANPAEDLEVQMRKLADGLLSGRYSKPENDAADSRDGAETLYQKGIAPAMLKHLIGRGHAEFSTVRQQDAFELLLHLLKLTTRSQQNAQTQSAKLVDPVSAFRFVMEQRLQCLSCQKVRYRQDEMENLSVAVPIRRVSPSNASIAGEHADGKKPDAEFEPVTLQQCLDDFTAAETVELTCAECNHKGFSKRTLFKTFPTILAVNARRFEIVNWVPTKQDVPVVVDNDEIDLEQYRSPGKQPDEVELVDNVADGANPSHSAFTANEAALEMLMSMGFPKNRCERALSATGNADAEAAASWLFEHMDDPDIDAPLDTGNTNAAGGSAVDPQKIEELGMMGFSAPQARQALKETAGDMERAVDWLFSHPDAIGDFGEDEAVAKDATSTTNAGSLATEDTKPARFTLNSIVCHKGTSIHAGHYVAFVKKPVPGGEEDWVLFNDEKVARGADADEMKKFAYIYFFRRQSE